MHYSLCDMFSDLAQNSVEAGAKRIAVRLIQDEEAVFFSVEDDGRGMTRDELNKAADPFYTDGVKHPGRRVGLGIPFLIQTADETGGFWKIETRAKDANVASISSGAQIEEGLRPAAKDEEETGTFLACLLDLQNIDLPPLGSVAGFFGQCLSLEGDFEMTAERNAPWTEYSLKRSEIIEALGIDGETGFADASALSLLGAYLESLEGEEV